MITSSQKWKCGVLESTSKCIQTFKSQKKGKWLSLKSEEKFPSKISYTHTGLDSNEKLINETIKWGGVIVVRGGVNTDARH